MHGEQLVRFRVDTETEEVLCTLPDCLSLEVAGGNYLIYTQMTELDEDRACLNTRLAALNLETLAVGATLESSEICIQDGTMVYLYAFQNGALAQEKYIEILAWDLSSGKVTTLVHYDGYIYLQENSKKFCTYVDTGFMAVMGDEVYYSYSDGDGSYSLYAVACDGTGKPHAVQIPELTDDVTAYSIQHDAGYFCAVTEDGSTVYGIDGDTGKLQRLFQCGEEIYSMSGVSTDQWYALTLHLTNRNEIVVKSLEE